MRLGGRSRAEQGQIRRPEQRSEPLHERFLKLRCSRIRREHRVEFAIERAVAEEFVLIPDQLVAQHSRRAAANVLDGHFHAVLRPNPRADVVGGVGIVEILHFAAEDHRQRAVDGILHFAPGVRFAGALLDELDDFLRRFPLAPRCIAKKHFLRVDLDGEFLLRPVRQCFLRVKRLEIFCQANAVAMIDLLDRRLPKAVLHLVGVHLSNLILGEIDVEAAHRPGGKPLGVPVGRILGLLTHELAKRGGDVGLRLGASLVLDIDFQVFQIAPSAEVLGIDVHLEIGAGPFADVGRDVIARDELVDGVGDRSRRSSPR